MKKLTPFLIWVMFLLYACVPVVQTSDEPFQTRIPFTPTPTKTPSATPEPTKTPDPLAGAPEGATGKDSKGNFIKTVTHENGITIEYSWTSLKDAKGDVLFEGWTLRKTLDRGIPIADYDEDTPLEDWGFIHVYVTDKAAGAASMPQLYHTSIVSEQRDEYQFTGSTYPDFNTRITGDRTPSGMPSYEFKIKMINGEIPFDFYTTTPDEKQEWYVSKDNGVKVIVGDWESLEGVFEFPDIERKMHFRSKILGVDSSGDLVGVIAADVPLDSLTEMQYWTVIFLHSASIVDGPDQTTPGLTDTLSGWLSELRYVSSFTGETWVETKPVE